MSARVRAKAEVKPTFTQQEAKELSAMLENHRSILFSVGNQEGAQRCEELRSRIVHASGKVPDA